MESRWIHILLKGELKQLATDTSESEELQDEYVREFQRRGCQVALVPILEIEFKNLENLAGSLHSLSETQQNGLIITSPRVVEAVDSALNQLDDKSSIEATLSKLQPNLVFVVGEKSARSCKTRLGLECNRESIESGDGAKLAEFIKDFCTRNHINCRLIRPKSSLADNKFEDILNESCGRIQLETLVVYETKTVHHMDQLIINTLKNSDILARTTKPVVNFIFFSPSGVKGFHHIDLVKLKEDMINQSESIEDIEFKYSSIGGTTESALRQKGFEVFCVATKPEPMSLVDAIFNKYGDQDL